LSQDDSGKKAKSIKLSVAVVLLIAAGIIAYFQVYGDDPATLALQRPFVDVESGEPFDYTIKMGDIEPIETPAGRMTGYQAERCFWGKDADGRWYIKETPTYVVLKWRIEPTSTEETICPDCGRRVVGHNKRPTPKDIDRANGGEESSGEEMMGD